MRRAPASHQLTLHPVSPIELAVAIDAAGMRVARTQTHRRLDRGVGDP